MTEFTLSGYTILAGTRILLPVDIASVEAGISLPVTGTVSVGSINTIIDVATVNAIIDVATIQSLGSIESPVAVGTILNAPLLTVQGTLTVATLLVQPLVTTQVLSKQTNILTNQTVIASGASTLLAGSLQNLVVDIVYGTVVTGSIQTAIVGVEPQSGVQTSTIVAGAWDASTVQTGQRLVAPRPLGTEVAAVWNVVSGSVLNVYITAEQS